MSKSNLNSTLVLLLTALTTGMLFADDGISSRRERQRERIREGVESRELNKRETRRLNREMKEVRIYTQGTRADGVVNAEERAGIKERRDALSQKIYNEKHDAQQAGESRRERQRDRIEAGVASGQLNNREEKRLNRGMKEIRDFNQGIKADGVVNDAERAGRKQLRDELSEKIYKEKHDNQTAGSLPQAVVSNAEPAVVSLPEAPVVQVEEFLPEAVIPIGVGDGESAAVTH